MLFKPSYLSSNFALTMGYLNPASNNPAQEQKLGTTDQGPPRALHEDSLDQVEGMGGGVGTRLYTGYTGKLIYVLL